MNLIKNEDMELRIKSGDAAASCPICGLPMRLAGGQIEVGWRLDKPAPEDDPKSTDVSFSICQTCAVTALRRVFEYCEGRGVDALPADKLRGRHPALR